MVKSNPEKTYKGRLVLLFLALGGLFCSPLQAQTKSCQFKAAELGEVVMLGFGGTKLTTQQKNHFLEICPGSVILFRQNLRNLQQAQSLIKDLRHTLRRCGQRRPFIAIDQEGGTVGRLRLEPALPSAQWMSQNLTPNQVVQLGREVGLMMQFLTINMNLAPVLDLVPATKKESAFMAGRSFGGDSNLVGEYGTAFARGLLESGVLPVGKHFPGMGGVSEDPHLVMVRRTQSIRSIKENDVLPFKKFFALETIGVMPSHLVYSEVDEQALPATFSKTILTDWLEKKMEFSGLVLTDDLAMKGAKVSTLTGQNILKALRAGAHIAMLTGPGREQTAGVRFLRSSLKGNPALQSTVCSRIRKVQEIKQELFSIPSPSEVQKVVVKENPFRLTTVQYQEALKKDRKQASIDP